ncbi:hypothetical protein LBMAG27_20030 [Bacteroidota bacterium]|nr:hypothetical protein LBMAG27_20030 [Bacteroidota bacterium]
MKKKYLNYISRIIILNKKQKYEKNSVIIFAFFLINLFCNAQAVLLKANTQIIIQNQNPLRSDGSQQAYFIVPNDFKDKEGNVLVAAGTLVNMNVVRQKGKAWGKPGYMNITAMNTTAVDGQIINLTGSYSQEGENYATIAWVVAGGGCLVVPLIGILGGFIVQGGNVEVPGQYLMMNVRTTEDTNINIGK